MKIFTTLTKEKKTSLKRVLKTVHLIKKYVEGYELSCY